MRLTSTDATDLEIWQAKIQAAPAANGYSQLAPAIWIGRCLANGTSMTRWTPDTLRGFLSFLDTLNITRLGIWPTTCVVTEDTDCDSGTPDIPITNVTEHCPWMYEALREWKGRAY